MSMCEVSDRTTLTAEEQDYASARGSADEAKRVIGDAGANSLDFPCMSKGIETLLEAIDQACRNPSFQPCPVHPIHLIQGKCLTKF